MQTLQGFEFVGIPLTLSAILFSHPFEVARVKIQYNDKSMFGDLPAVFKQLYQIEGLTGFYRGFTPRLI